MRGKTESLGVAEDSGDVGGDDAIVEELPGDRGSWPGARGQVGKGALNGAQLLRNELGRIDSSATVERRREAGLEVSGP
jgi:hypothetical protein